MVARIAPSVVRKFFANAKLPKARGRGVRRVPGVMNKTEAVYADLLSARVASGELLGWWFEPIKLRLADRTFYEVDFMLMNADATIEFVDVKGTFTEEDAKVKFKVARELFPMFKLRMISGCRKKGSWTWKELYTEE
jgi:hypothetical protein